MEDVYQGHHNEANQCEETCISALKFILCDVILNVSSREQNENEKEKEK